MADELTPLEMARDVRQLMRETGWTLQQAAERLGFTPSYLKQAARLPCCLAGASRRRPKELPRPLKGYRSTTSSSRSPTKSRQLSANSRRIWLTLACDRWNFSANGFVCSPNAIACASLRSRAESVLSHAG
jgi:hypothetical protein